MEDELMPATDELDAATDVGGDAEPDGYEEAPWVDPEAVEQDEEPWDFVLDDEGDPDMGGYEPDDPDGADEGVDGEDDTSTAEPVDATDLDVPEESDGTAPAQPEPQAEEVDGVAVDDDGTTAEAADGGEGEAWDEWGTEDPDWDATLVLPDAGEDAGD